jgi:hypothetical protein
MEDSIMLKSERIARSEAARARRKERKEILLGKTERLYTKLRNLRRKAKKRVD